VPATFLTTHHNISFSFVTPLSNFATTAAKLNFCVTSQTHFYICCHVVNFLSMVNYRRKLKSTAGSTTISLLVDIAHHSYPQRLKASHSPSTLGKCSVCSKGSPTTLDREDIDEASLPKHTEPLCTMPCVSP
jgi:hypothetical protein